MKDPGPNGSGRRPVRRLAHREAETHGAETHEAETHEAETHGAETHGAETHGAETHGAETKEQNGRGFRQELDLLSR